MTITRRSGPKLVALAVAAAVFAASCSGSGISQDDLDAETARAEAAERDVEIIRDDLSSSEAVLSNANADLAAVTQGLADSDSRVSELERDVESLNSGLAASEAEVTRLSTSLEQAAEELAPFVVVDGDVDVLRLVQSRGRLRCGVQGLLSGFSSRAPDGSMQGIDAEFCRALAAATLGDPDAVEFVTLRASERFNALTDGLVDVLFRVTTHTLTRDATLGVDFGPVTFYDGQQFLGRGSDGFTADSPIEAVDGAVVCGNNPRQQASIDLAASAVGFDHQFTLVANPAEAMDRFEQGVCDLVTTDGIGLIAGRFDRGHPEWVIFPPIPLTREPLAAVVVEGATRWREIVSWTVNTTIIAAEHGVTSENLSHPAVVDLFDFDRTQALGLRPDALRDVIRLVGNYNEIFAGTLGTIGVEQTGLNRLWTDGGLIYAPRP